MIPPRNCPYKGLSAPPCGRCQWYNADMGQCNMAHASAARSAGEAVQASAFASTFEDRLKRYEHDRQELLKLSKEALVDLILHRPTLY